MYMYIKRERERCTFDMRSHSEISNFHRSSIFNTVTRNNIHNKPYTVYKETRDRQEREVC